MWEVKSRKFWLFGRIYGHVIFTFLISVIGIKYMQGYGNALDILVKFVIETSFFNKADFSEVLWLLQWVSFSGKDYYVLPLVLLVLNKFYYFEIAIQVTNYHSSKRAIQDKQNEELFVKIGQAVQKLWTFQNWKKC